jgi:DNA mismatch endonuclease (patch repair protein)
MARIGSKNTAPELAVRRVAHRVGLRFRLHRRDLPGTPDLVFPKHGTVVFVHGCYWHRHAGCARASTPVTNAPKWLKKFERNVARDVQVKASLEEAGWRVLVIWECETHSVPSIERKLGVWFPPA